MIKNNLLTSLVLVVVASGLVACNQAVTPKKVIANPYDQMGIAEGEMRSQKVSSQVDVLFVVDDSGSMEEEQKKLKDAIPALVGSLGSHLDWQIGVTRSWDDSNVANIYQEGTTQTRNHFFKPVPIKQVNGSFREMKKGELIPVINPMTGDVVVRQDSKEALRYITKNTSIDGHSSLDLLNQHLLVGFRGYSNFKLNAAGKPSLDSRGQRQPLPVEVGWGPQYEVLMDVALVALARSGVGATENRGFLRPGSRLVIVFLTDAPDASSSKQTIQDYADEFKYIALRNIKGANSEQTEQALTVYGIIPHKPLCGAGESKGDMDPDIKGLRLPHDLRTYQLVESTMGASEADNFTFDICSPPSEYKKKMQNLGASIKESTKIYLHLENGPNDKRMKVWFGKGTPGTEGWDGVQLKQAGYRSDRGGDWYVDNIDGKSYLIINLSVFDKYGLDSSTGEVKVTCYFGPQKHGTVANECDKKLD